MENVIIMAFIDHRYLLIRLGMTDEFIEGRRK